MNRDREAARDLSKRLEKAQEEIEKLGVMVDTAQDIARKRGAEIASLKEDNQLLRRKIENHILMSADFQREYDQYLDDLSAKFNVEVK